MSLEPLQLLMVAIAAFGASLVGGVTGYGTGLLLPPVLVPLIGAEAVVPVIALASLLTNAGRVAAFWEHLDRQMALRITLIALPTTVLGALGYTLLSGKAAMILIGVVLLILIPLRRTARRMQLTLGPRGVGVAALVYGVVVGGTAGSGVMLLTILLSTGLTGTAVIATDAAISIILGIAKTGTFFTAGAFNLQLVMIALMIGAAAFPGAFVAKKLALALKGETHIIILDAAVALGGIFLLIGGLRA